MGGSYSGAGKGQIVAQGTHDDPSMQQSDRIPPFTDTEKRAHGLSKVKTSLKAHSCP
jgi:hypothetical protein